MPKRKVSSVEKTGNYEASAGQPGCPQSRPCESGSKARKKAVRVDKPSDKKLQENRKSSTKGKQAKATKPETKEERRDKEEERPASEEAGAKGAKAD
uniref:non-histone chromosomal protein HMG-14-like n=1 Tax=Jaculus jaculus TaxID=51337 RepID=UPI000333310F|nr:non-histone chromosomal protein HMG-14-like [Jaculus jaculus]